MENIHGHTNLSIDDTQPSRKSVRLQTHCLLHSDTARHSYSYPVFQPVFLSSPFYARDHVPFARCFTPALAPLSRCISSLCPSPPSLSLLYGERSEAYVKLAACTAIFHTVVVLLHREITCIGEIQFFHEKERERERREKKMRYHVCASRIKGCTY